MPLRMGKAGEYRCYDLHHGLISLFAAPDERGLVDADVVPPLRYERPVVKSCDNMVCMASLRDRTETGNWNDGSSCLCHL